MGSEDQEREQRRLLRVRRELERIQVRSHKLLFWKSFENLEEFIENPKNYICMSLASPSCLKNISQVANFVEFRICRHF